MNEKLKSIIEKVIEMKYIEMEELNFEDMTEKEKAEHEEVYNKVLELQNRLHKEFTKEQWGLVSDCMDAENLLSALEQRYMFNRGVKRGLNELSFIKDELGNGVVLL